MQIEKIILYGEQDRIRILDFAIGKVNIITGDSKTGKSSLIEIVNYCLGGSDGVSDGIVKDTVLWFAVLLKLGEGSFYVARPNTAKINVKPGQASCFMLQATKIELPRLSEIEPNATITALKTKLAGILGISEYVHESENFSRQNLSVTFKHSRIYSFQTQTDIDQRHFLFFHQNRNANTAQAIKDTLPYFLGAIREDHVRLKRDLADKKRSLNRLVRELRTEQNIAARNSDRVYELIAEAKQVELIDAEAIAENEEIGVAILSRLSQQDLTDVEAVGEDESLIKLQTRRMDLKRELNSLSENIRSAESFEKEAFGFSTEAEHQVQRLESVNIFPENGDRDSHLCPLCEQKLERQIPSVEAINKSLLDLRNSLEVTIKERPKLTKYIEEQKSGSGEKKEEIAEIDREINAIYKERTETRNLKDLNLRKGRVLGRVGLYIESYKKTRDFSKLQQKIDRLKLDVVELEGQLGSEQIEERLNDILDQISVQMSEWAKDLELEYQNAILKFSIKYLTIEIVEKNRKTRLDKIGSGENWVAYHLLIHFALHSYFIKNNRPVPSFLMLDQFSQAYLPPEGIKDSKDNQAIKRICDFIFDRVEEENGQLQVIVTEHADPDHRKFRDATLEKWRDGKKLIPADWYQ